ncbi:MAG: Ig-like domain-containing protein, partial [Myxococcota bacterium]
VIFNPGRTKRGVGSNLEGGPPLEPNRDYALRIRAGLRDAEGDPLPADFLHRFRTTEPLREPLDIDRWDVQVPAPGTRDPLTVTFDRWVDPDQAEHRILLYNGHQRRFPIRAESSGRSLTLTPLEDWREGCLTLAVSPELEDVSGNRTVRAFDQLGKGSRTARFRPIEVGEGLGCAPALTHATRH